MAEFSLSGRLSLRIALERRVSLLIVISFSGDAFENFKSELQMSDDGNSDSGFSDFVGSIDNVE